MLFFTLSIITVMSFLFVLMMNPLSMGLVLLFQTIMIATTTGCVANSFWFGYILFLIFLGGMLVLFIYVAAIAANEQFSFNFKLFMMVLIFSTLPFMIFMFLDPLMISSKVMMFLSSFSAHLNFPSNSSQVSLLYNNPSYSFTIFIISYLLLALLVIVKIMNMSSNPLRLSY
uniref:NADH-ubiquinone oxidoreductase chain 6 n=1 Tax=Grimothea gregaria TaxID=306053 RepID=A0A342KBL4_9EUCA|nr:NADH dehydrogenase subunit 6 [Grimothea gregaria]AND82244.1 NADH dehydrogenase subunit 6 [Grimothea gregaria]